MAFVVYSLHILRTIFFYSDITSGMIAAIILMVGIIIGLTWVLEVNRRSSQYRLILTLRHAFHQYEEKYLRELNKQKTITPKQIPEEGDRIVTKKEPKILENYHSNGE